MICFVGVDSRKSAYEVPTRHAIGRDSSRVTSGLLLLNKTIRFVAKVPRLLACGRLFGMFDFSSGGKNFLRLRMLLHPFHDQCGIDYLVGNGDLSASAT